MLHLRWPLLKGMSLLGVTHRVAWLHCNHMRMHHALRHHLHGVAVRVGRHVCHCHGRLMLWVQPLHRCDLRHAVCGHWLHHSSMRHMHCDWH
jgi:hypothetical protein